MIIVSQNKDVIVNTNTIACIQTSKENIGNIEVILFNKVDIHNGLTIGEYKTEERAEEVFKELMERYRSWENLKYGQPKGICEPVYYMPEE